MISVLRVHMPTQIPAFAGHAQKDSIALVVPISRLFKESLFNALKDIIVQKAPRLVHSARQVTPVQLHTQRQKSNAQPGTMPEVEAFLAILLELELLHMHFQLLNQLLVLGVQFYRLQIPKMSAKTAARTNNARTIITETRKEIFNTNVILLDLPRRQLSCFASPRQWQEAQHMLRLVAARHYS